MLVDACDASGAPSQSRATHDAPRFRSSLVPLYCADHIIPVTTANAELNITDGATLTTLLSSVDNSTFQAASIANVTFKTFAP